MVREWSNASRSPSPQTHHAIGQPPHVRVSHTVSPFDPLSLAQACSGPAQACSPSVKARALYVGQTSMSRLQFSGERRSPGSLSPDPSRRQVGGMIPGVFPNHARVKYLVPPGAQRHRLFQSKSVLPSVTPGARIRECPQRSNIRLLHHGELLTQPQHLHWTGHDENDAQPIPPMLRMGLGFCAQALSPLQQGNHRQMFYARMTGPPVSDLSSISQAFSGSCYHGMVLRPQTTFADNALACFGAAPRNTWGQNNTCLGAAQWMHGNVPCEKVTMRTRVGGGYGHHLSPPGRGPGRQEPGISEVTVYQMVIPAASSQGGSTSITNFGKNKKLNAGTGVPEVDAALQSLFDTPEIQPQNASPSGMQVQKLPFRPQNPTHEEEEKMRVTIAMLSFTPDQLCRENMSTMSTVSTMSSAARSRVSSALSSTGSPKSSVVEAVVSVERMEAAAYVPSLLPQVTRILQLTLQETGPVVAARHIQRIVRGWIGRCAALRRFRWVLRLQTTFHTMYCRRRFIVMRKTVTRIAATFRSYRARKVFLTFRGVIVVIQRCIQLWRARRRTKLEAQATQTIQAAWLGMKDRKRVRRLRCSIRCKNEMQKWTASSDEAIIRRHLSEANQGVRQAALTTLMGGHASHRTLGAFLANLGKMKTQQVGHESPCDSSQVMSLATEYQKRLSQNLSTIEPTGQERQHHAAGPTKVTNSTIDFPKTLLGINSVEARSSKVRSRSQSSTERFVPTPPLPVENLEVGSDGRLLEQLSHCKMKGDLRRLKIKMKKSSLTGGF